MQDRDYMQLAIDMARSALGQTSPNPAVGAVVVKNGQVTGLGAHLRAGEPHAEVHALKMAGEKANGGVLYVTLEPCSHYGKTPPCADLVMKSGIRKVFVASTDPNPLVCGKGIARLKEAGIEVQTGLLEEEANKINEVFFHHIKTGLPFVTLKTAMTFDGKISTASGESKWITGSEARADVQQLRHRHDAIMVGIGTVIQDNPSLTARIPGGGKNPIRIILDSKLLIPLTSRLLNDKEASVWVIAGRAHDREKASDLRGLGAEVIEMEGSRPAVIPLLKELSRRGITSLFVEGGAEVHGSFLKEQAFQQIIAYMAPKLFGGRDARTAFGGEGISRMADAAMVEFTDISKVGSDIRITAKPARR
ncbi:bifunctional diaminohydroxyphosphoribosylaminopyrimidine deaminase/5-amino-6-(5-phosphoribosylamino)uracil reductase RibD [Mesobacillus zeae]|uniref:Riboflavin biosynthesis protein RibD n=1 Tax=Mesobacillus zeae TaxID=1917180 RepID=A0A398BA19_9BACI|nr:bifunctional diaminohydroxyphosphoribosylaminopyrimidine deaminase/5-amino-6-(5-phosphoribosylamino)uracil reductase RibD [Mesobacillus zeae]RID85688.1 bifunctional diaminohydroxyphosphoribosylaminopyrimidine deaminase/5-amino-6-(5-phosphoribosylamino)uracil reductase RibD [Mesobacillus zeae]